MINRARLVGFVVAIIASFPLGILMCSRLFALPIPISVAVLVLCHLVVGPVFFSRVVKGEVK